MIRKILAATTLFIPYITFATEIHTLAWVPSNQTLIALTDTEILFLQDAQATSIKGPNTQMQDLTLFENNQQLLVSTKAGVYQSELANIKWSAVNEGLETENISFVFTNIELQNVLYAATQDSIYKKTPEDTEWVNMDIGPGGAVTDYIHSNMPESMETGWIFASTETGVSFTADCFCFWRDVKDFSANVHAIAFQPEQPSTFFAATSDAIYVTTDGARTWSTLSSIPFENSTAIVAGGLTNLYIGNGDGEIWALNRSSLQWSKLN